MEAPMAGQPLLDLGMFVRGIVIRDQIDLLACRGNLVNHAQEFQPLLMPVPVVAHADYGAIERAHGRKQGCCSIAFVVVGHRSAAPLF